LAVGLYLAVDGTDEILAGKPSDPGNELFWFYISLTALAWIVSSVVNHFIRKLFATYEIGEAR